MSRIRTIKPEFFADEKVGKLSLRGRLLFIALWCFADDMGTVRGGPAYLRANAFPYDEVSLGEMEQSLAELKRVGLVVPFTGEGENYLSIRHFQRHQKINRPGGPKYPNPPDDLETRVLTEGSVNPHGGVTEDAVGDPIRSDPIRTRSEPEPSRVVFVGPEGKA